MQTEANGNIPDQHGCTRSKKYMINTYRLSYDYVKTDENDNITHVNRALDDISIDIKKGDFIAVLGQPLPNT